MAPLVTLEAGHGGRDPGAVGHGLRESDVALQIALKTEEVLTKRYEVRVQQIRTGDNYISLADRVNAANEADSDLYVSVHVNAAGSASANGFETWIYENAPEQTRRRAEALHREAVKPWVNQGRADRGVKEGRWYVVRNTRMSAALVECGFITNSEDASLLQDDGFIKAQAEALADGIAAALELQRKEGEDKEGEKLEEHWAWEAIKWAKETGLMSGYEDGTWKPDQPLTRAEFAWVLKKYDEGR